MELDTIKIIAMQGGAVGLHVVGLPDGMVPETCVIAMDEITIAVPRDSGEKRGPQIVDVVPTDLRNLELTVDWGEFFHGLGEDAKAGRIVLFAVAAHQLHAEANAQHRLTKFADQFIQFPLPKIIHRG